MFKEIADIKTSDQLKLPVPEAEYETVVLKPTEQQKEIVESLGERAEVVRNGGVDAAVDNMLKITNDGRKLALDQRLVNELLPDNPESSGNSLLFISPAPAAFKRMYFFPGSLLLKRSCTRRKPSWAAARIFKRR